MYKEVNSVKDSLERSKKYIAVFLDKAKAFDTVLHDRLLEVMENYGIRGTALKIVKDYLNNRKHSEKIRDSLNTQIGIPQGTVLGPLLSITYINSLLKLKLSKSTISYADDTVLYTKIKIQSIFNNKLQET